MTIYLLPVQNLIKNEQDMFDRNKPFNELPSLPIKENIIDTDILKLWGITSRALAELSRNVMRMPNPTMLVNTIALQESKSSTEIENIFTTQDALYQAVSENNKEANANHSTKEVLKYREALWEGYSQIQKAGQLNTESIVNIFQTIKDTKQGVRSPQSQVVIKRGQSEHRPGEVIYTPPRGEGIVEEKLDNLLHFLNEKNDFDPLLKMIIGHYQFEAIHPFTDGNGRTGRIINLLYLVSQNLISYPVLYLSKYIINHKDEYYFALGAVSQRQAWKPWILFMLQAVLETSIHTNQMIDTILSQMEATYNYTKPKLSWYSLELNQALFSQPYIKQKLIGKLTGVTSRTTLTKYAKQLTDLGILSSKEVGREVFYVNDDLMRILED